ncbi:restriction endonuclease subunit S [Nonomuraea sp. NPDC004580]|uniref:restriction endonuclease subunit S n=1 Tax=Nonomuraea sp. NPDC004580 TaxID=3154552 RepID=UPI0033B5C85E
MSEPWIETRLGEIADTLLGKTLPKGSGKDADGYPYLRNVNVQWHRITTTGLNTMSFNEAERDKYRLCAGDILLCEGGEVGRLALVRDDLDGIYFQNALHRVRLRVGAAALPEFIALGLENVVSGGHLDTLVTKTTIAHINQAKLRSLPVTLPPLSTQQRIVKVIGAVDDQITALDAEARALAAVLRRRRADLITDDSGVAVRAENAFDFSTGVRRTPDRATGPYMTPYLRSANVGYGTLDLSDVLEMNYDPVEREKFGLRYGDVVVSEGSASANAVGMPAMWRDELPGPVCTQMTLLRLRALEGVCIPEFVFHWSMWAYESRAFLDIAGGTNIKHISAKRAKGMIVRLPSLDRQREMVAELDAMESVVKATRAEAARLRDVRAGLLAGLLDRTVEIESAKLEV